MALYSARNIPLYVVTVIPILISETCGILCDWEDSNLIDKFLDYQKKIATTEENLKGDSGWLFRSFCHWVAFGRHKP